MVFIIMEFPHVGVLPWQSHFTFVTFKHLIFTLSLTVIIGQNLLSSVFTFTFKFEILRSFISSHVWFCHASQKDQYAPHMFYNYM